VPITPKAKVFTEPKIHISLLRNILYKEIFKLFDYFTSSQARI